jgi:predicted DNA-binding ribbon-helix-helix protein
VRTSGEAARGARVEAAKGDYQVRGVEKPLWARLRAAAALRSLTVGALLNEIIRDWLGLYGPRER